MNSKLCLRFEHRDNKLCSECGKPREEGRFLCPHCNKLSSNSPDSSEIAIRTREIRKDWPWWRLAGFIMVKDVPELVIPCATEVTDHRRRKSDNVHIRKVC